MTIADVLRTDDRFSTLTAALDSAGLDSTLRGEGPYTLFAPPNAAFNALPEGTMPVLFNDRPEQLRTVLVQHIVPRRVPMSGRSGASARASLEGDTLRIAATDTSVTLRNAQVVDRDIETANGLIHVVDQVLQPSSNEPEGAGTGPPFQP